MKKQDPKGSQFITKQKWESLCKQCGKCCAYKVRQPDGTLKAVGMCVYNDRKTGKCLVYEQRFAVAPWCQHIGVDIQHGLAPEDCGYAKLIPGYRSIVDWGALGGKNED